MQLNWYSVIMLIGVVQGVFFGLALWTKRAGNQQANRFLAAFALAVAVILADELIESTGLLAQYPHALGLLWPTVFLIGPLFWWYVRSMIGGGIDFDRKHLIAHLIPAALSYILQLPLLILNIEPPYAIVVLIFFIMVSHTGYYIIDALRRVRAYNHGLPDTYSYDETINLRWLNYFTITFCGVWIFFLIGEFVGGTVGSFLVTLVDLDMVAILFIIGFFATRQVTAPTGVVEVVEEVLAEIPTTKYQSSALSAEQAAHIEQRLLTLMQTAKPYREGKLTLPQLASQLNTSPNYLSQIINERLGRNFFDFVNQYRIKEAQQRLLTEPNRTILDIALDSGFNSKSAFYKVFKQQTGMTPSAFRKTSQSPSLPERN